MQSEAGDYHHDITVSNTIPQNINHYYELEGTNYELEGTNYEYNDVKPHPPQHRGPTSGKFNCGPCDRSFFTNGMYEKHLNEHSECPFPECQFIASTKIIDQHISHQHMMINFENLQVDDDKWIDSRKKRFPTILRADQRRAQQVELLKRGERMGLNKKKFGIKKNSFDNKIKCQIKNYEDKSHKTKNYEDKSHKTKNYEVKSHKTKNYEDKGKKFKSKRTRSPMKLKEHNTTPKFNIDLYESDSEIKREVKAFKGIGEASQLKIETMEVDNFNISDDEWNTPVVDKPTTITNALGSLMGMYCSSDEDIPLPKESKSVESIQKPNTCTTMSNENASNSSNHSTRKRKRKRGNQLDSNYKNKKSSIQKSQIYQKRKKDTLLEKLLASDIRHERNMVLQCIRYILNEKYFEEEKK